MKILKHPDFPRDAGLGGVRGKESAFPHGVTEPTKMSARQRGVSPYGSNPKRVILVTGGAGLVGSHTAEFYAKRGEEVIVLDNLMRSQLFGYKKESVEYNWHYLKKYSNIKLIKGDVRNEKDVLEALGKGVDVVIHTAGQPGVPLSVRIPKEDFSINAFGTLNVLECVRQKCPQAAFIYCSTNKVYGENVDNIPLEEKKG